MLYPDPTNRVGAALAGAAPAAAAPPPAQPVTVTDAEGTVHRFTPVSGPVTDEVARLLAGKRLYIADGHHRYETALYFRDERRAAGDHSADSVMVYLCSMDDPGLVVFPTHRLLKGVPVPPADELLARLAPTFAVYPERPEGAQSCAVMMGHVGSLTDAAKVFGLYFPHERTCATIELRDPSAITRLIKEGLSPEYASLSVTLLQYLIFRDALGLDPTRTEGKIDYATRLDEALALLDGDGGYTLGAFVNATPIAEVRRVADRGETMPHKSTYFHPKPATGLVFHVMEDGAGETRP